MEATIREYALLQTGDCIVVGVSGGPDSLALLEGLRHLSAAYAWQIVAVHVNHQLRGEEAIADARFVAQFCRDRDIAYYVRSVDVRRHLQENGGNLQEVARRLRYDVFRDVAARVGATKLALGHHADDQAETVLMRFLRGSGTAGLVGIPVKRTWEGIDIVRPLWRTWRTTIEAFCREAKLAPRDDSSNHSTNYVRNRVRLELIPVLEQYNPQIKTGMLQLSEQLAAEEVMWDNWTKEAADQVIVKRDATECVLSIPEFHTLNLALQRRVVQLILSYLSIRSWVHIEQIRLLTYRDSPSAQHDLPGEWEAVRDYNFIRFRRRQEPSASEGDCTLLNVPGVTRVPAPYDTYLTAVVTSDDIETCEWGMRWAVFDAEHITGKLYVRTRLPGDRIHIKGMSGKKRVKTLFIDEKVGRDVRSWWPIVTDETDILWIPELRRSQKALVSAGTKQRIYLFFHTGHSLHM